MFHVVERPKLYEQVVEQIKDMIIKGIYKRGELLPSEKELIEMTGVSRITVREALRLLNEAGVIETHKGKGSFVMVDAGELHSAVDGKQDYRKHFLDSTTARILLEPAVAREVASAATDEELAVIERSLNGTESSDEVDFHRAIIRVTKNPIVIHWFEELHAMEAAPSILGLVPPARQKSVSAQINRQHQYICEALKTRNGEFAYFYMKEHLVFIRDIYEEYFKVFY